MNERTILERVRRNLAAAAAQAVFDTQQPCTAFFVPSGGGRRFD